jgi:excisionase family DNA binding protein
MFATTATRNAVDFTDACDGLIARSRKPRQMNRDAEKEELLTVRELAREWRQSESTIYRKVERGLIPAVRLGNGTSALRIPRSALERSLHVQGSGGPSRPKPAGRRVPGGPAVETQAPAGER